MIDPYELLGVGKEASADEIKKAYKRQAQKNHPDKGGTTDAFKKIKEAFDILNDPDRRYRYDTTGRTDNTNISQQATARLCSLFQAWIQQHAGKTNADPLKDIDGTIAAALESVPYTIEEINGNIERVQKQIDKKNVKTNGRQNLFNVVASQLLEDLKSQLRGVEDEKEIIEATAELLKHYEFESEQTEQNFVLSNINAT